MRAAASILLMIVLGHALAQTDRSPGGTAELATPPEPTEEVVVRGQRLADLRYEVQQAREHAYAIFNDINSSDDFDVYCKNERKYHSRATRRVCRARFESRISADAAKEYMATLIWNCPAGPGGFIDTQACMFSGPGQTAKLAAQRVEGQAPPMRDRMHDEIVRLANENDQFAQAILDFYEASQQYEVARGRGDD